MTQIPTVTVVIPTYNRADLLRRAVRSVQQQTYADWELIIVDDASTDETTAVVEAIADRRVRGVRRANNGGVAAAQNTGIDHARGRYICFLHSDDEYLPERLSTLVPILSAAPQAVGAESAVEISEGKCTFERAPYLASATARDLIEYRAGVHVATLLLRREQAAAIRFDERLRGTEDRDFCIRLLRRGAVVSLGEVLVRIDRTHPRLGSQPKGPIYEYLLAKYSDDITPYPEVHAAWLFRISRAHARAGDLGRARSTMRQSLARYPQRARRWPLLAAAHMSDRAFAATLKTYLAMAHVTA